MAKDIRSLLFICFITSALIFGCSSDSKTLKISPSKLDFGDVNLGDISDIEVTLTNKYGKDISITSLTITGSSDYSITNGGATPINILKGAEHKITVSFDPSTSGPIEGTLTISHDGSTKEKVVALTGSGVPVARIQLSDTTFDFTKKLINKSHTHDVTIDNIGTSDLSVSALTFSGLGASSYKISAGNAPFNVQPGTSKTITISFEPVAVGIYEADLNIDHNAVNENTPLIYSVKGEGIDVNPQITLSIGSSWDFGLIATTMPSTQVCEIENTGIDPLTVTSGTLTTGTEFVIDSLEDSNGNPINFPQVLSVGAKINLYIKFSPTAKTTYNDTLTFVHDGTNENSPWAIPLSGEGRDEIVKTFSYTGSAQQWTVPAGVTQIKVDAYGGAGGESYPTGSGHNPGLGGLVSALLAVTPGDNLQINVGGEGQDGTSGSGGAGGWNGGGKGSTYGSYNGAGGGGASDIRSGGTTLGDRIIVAGAGGGSAFNYFGGGDHGGDGGGLIGDDGYSNFVLYGSATYCGKGGTQSAGGIGGTGGGMAGTIGVGGDGASGTNTAGGGGAGYYGGGGGYYGGAGGGSSYTMSGASNVTHTQGVRSGDGEITITY